MSEWPKNAVLLSLHITHYLSIAVWVGVMLFNLIVNFPAVRSRSQTPADFVGAMSAQSKRAGPWLYILIALTVLSGWALSVGKGGPHYGVWGATAWVKSGLLLCMLALHLWASLRLWPQIHFALEAQWPKLFFQYQLSIALSSAFGLAAIFVTYFQRIF